MKSVYFRIPSCLIGGILVCISMAAAFGADASVPNSKTVQREPGGKEAVVTVEMVAGENPQTVHLYPFDQIPRFFRSPRNYYFFMVCRSD